LWSINGIVNVFIIPNYIVEVVLLLWLWQYLFSLTLFLPAPLLFPGRGRGTKHLCFIFGFKYFCWVDQEKAILKLLIRIRNEHWKSVISLQFTNTEETRLKSKVFSLERFKIKIFKFSVSPHWIVGWVENEKSYKLFLSHPKLIVIHKTKDFLQNRYFDFGFALYLIWENNIFAPIWTLLIDCRIFWSILVNLFMKSDDNTQNSESLCWRI